MGQFKSYGPRIVQFIADEDLTAGKCVAISGMTTCKNPAPSLELTLPVPKVKKVEASATTDFLGVVMYDASDTEWVDVCVEGICEAEFVAAADINAGNPLIVGGTAGQLDDLAASSLADTNNICCFAAETEEDDSTTAGEKIRVYIPPRNITSGGALI